MTPVRAGLVLPHFGPHAGANRLLDGARRAEALGFDSVWVRDHLVPRPQSFEPENATFYEAFTVLAAVGAVTERITLGTGAFVPFRHPVHAALIAATLTALYGPRLILGAGTGSGDHEFEAVGLGGIPRADLLAANVEIMRRLWAESDVAWQDEVFDFSGVTLSPRPPEGRIPIWYCGSSPKGARVAAATYDGWLPGRLPLATLAPLVGMLHERAEEHGRARPVVGTIPAASVAASHEAALARIDVDALLETANRTSYWRKPASGRFETIDDLDGLVLHGTPDAVLEQCLRLRDAGVDHIVFDFRMSFDRWEEQVQLLAEEVLPGLRGAPLSAPPAASR